MYRTENDLSFLKKLIKTVKKEVISPLFYGFSKGKDFLEQLFWKCKGRIFYKHSRYYKEKKTAFSKLHLDYGAYGEYLLSSVFQKYKGKWLFNLYFDTKKGTTEIDALLISTKGIFVFEVKNYKGRIYGSKEQKEWFHLVKNKKGTRKFRFFNPLMQNSGHLHALTRFLGEKASLPIYSAVVFTPGAKLKLQTEKERVFTFYTVKRWMKKKKNQLSKTEIEQLYQQLKECTKVTFEEKLQHQKEVSQRNLS